MPYIGLYRRKELDIQPPDTKFLSPGELNYVLTKICLFYLEDKGISYQTINDIVGALEGSKLEFYRRIANKYEDDSVVRNGDVYP